MSRGAPGQQGVGAGMAAGLGDGSAVDGGVQAPVSATVQAPGVLPAAGGPDRRGAVVPGVGGLAAEPADVAGLAQDPGSGDDADPGDAQQFWHQGSDQDLHVRLPS